MICFHYNNINIKPQVPQALRSCPDTQPITYYEEACDKNGRFLAPGVIYHYHYSTYEKTIKPGARSNKLNTRIGNVEGTYEVRIAIKTWQIGDTLYGLRDEDLVWLSFTR